MDFIKKTLVENLGQPFHSLASGDEVFTLDQVPDLNGKVGVITGGSEGIGFGSTHTLLSKKISKLFILSKSEDKIDEALDAIRKDCKLAAVTRSEKGSVVVRGDETVDVEAIEIRELVDTTGAGDLYAAGFLAGYTADRSLADCGKLGSLAAGLVIQQIGPRPMQNLKNAAREAGLL